MSLFTYGPFVPFFAWRPVDTRDAGWVWLRRIRRRRCYVDEGPAGPFWDYYRHEPRTERVFDARDEEAIQLLKTDPDKFFQQRRNPWSLNE